MPTSWVYQLRKEDLIRELEKRGKSTENLTVEELRRQLTQMVKDEESHEEVYQDTMPEKGREKTIDGKIWKLWENSIEKWNIHFDGTGDPVEFIEKIEELIDTTGADKFKLLPIIPRILQDIQTLMRRQGKLSEQERLERIFENMDPNFKYYIKRQDFETLRDLIKLAIDYERITAEKYRKQELTTSYHSRNEHNRKQLRSCLNVDEHLTEYKEFVASTVHPNRKKKKTVGEKKESGQQIRDSKNLQKREGDVTSPATRYARLPPRSATRAAHQAARTRNPAQTGLTALWWGATAI
ncbi:hypothetical protein ACJJTC_013589 [Scirpophaga incertulas]